MAKNIKWVAAIILATLVQTTWPDVLRLQAVTPDLVLLLVVYFAIAEGEERAMFTGLIGGIFQDAAYSTALGHHVFCHVVVGYLVGRIATRFVTEHPAVKAGSVLCAGLVGGALFTTIQYIQTPSVLFLNSLVGTVVPTAFYTAVITPVVFWILARVFRAEPAPGVL